MKCLCGAECRDLCVCLQEPAGMLPRYPLDAAPLTRVEAAVPSPIQAESAGSNEGKRIGGWCQWCGQATCFAANCLKTSSAALPQEAAPSATWTNAEIHAFLDAPPSALDVAAIVDMLNLILTKPIAADMYGRMLVTKDTLRKAVAALEREHAAADMIAKERDAYQKSGRLLMTALESNQAKVAALEARLARVIEAGDIVVIYYEDFAPPESTVIAAYRAARDAP